MPDQAPDEKPTTDLPPTVQQSVELPGTVDDVTSGSWGAAAASEKAAREQSTTPVPPGQPVVPPPRVPRSPSTLLPGDRIDDYEILSVLGKGAFATVYLARQLSLERQVALKVSANRGSEARTLANMEHEHIVRVFSESVEPQRDLRLLCMQYVNGTTLEKIIAALGKRKTSSWSGQAILEAIEELARQPALFDPAALRDREQLQRCDFVEAVCWFGVRLAEALAHAHSQGVLHRDIKPANILINRYGRPLLADFNVAFDPRPVEGSARKVLGGTIAYMSPEHLDACNPDGDTLPEAVDQRSDIYSLGMVLFELLTGTQPFGTLPRSAKVGESLKLLATQRRGGPPDLAWKTPESEILDRVIRRCLDSDPARRFQTAAELAQALQGCLEHRRVEKDLPAPGPLTRAAARHPFRVGVVLLLWPHVVGSVVNITYNSVRIVGNLDPEQQQTFARLVLYYNLVVYSGCVALMLWLVVPLYRGWGRLCRREMVDPSEATALRQQASRFPLWMVFLSAAGWLPGGLFFPLALDCFGNSCGHDIFSHFLISCTISGSIALTYSVLGMRYLVLRIFYPQLWIDAHGLREQAREELKPVARRLRFLQLLAGLIPLSAAIMMVSVGPDDLGDVDSYTTFRLLVTAMIALGMVGFGVALSVSNQLHQTLAALTGASKR